MPCVQFSDCLAESAVVTRIGIVNLYMGSVLTFIISRKLGS